MIDDYLKKKKESQAWNDINSIYSTEKELIDDVMVLNGEILWIMKSGCSVLFSPHDGAFKILNKEETDKIADSLTKDLEHESIAREKAIRRNKESQEAKPAKKEENDEQQPKSAGNKTP